MATLLGFALLCGMGFGFGASVACGVYFTTKWLRSPEPGRGMKVDGPSGGDIRAWGCNQEASQPLPQIVGRHFRHFEARLRLPNLP